MVLKRRTISFLPWLLVGLLLCGLAGCRLSQPSEAARQALKNEVTTAKKQLEAVGSLVAQGGQLSGQDERGRPLWDLQAKEMRVKGQGEGGQPVHATLTTAHATLYREGKAESTFQAAKIEFINTPAAVRMVMTGGVKATTSGPKTGGRGPVTMQAPEAQVNVKTHRLRATQVTMTQGPVHVVGQALTADTALAVAQLSRNVKATGPDGTVTADAAEWKWRQGRAQARGKVVAVHQDTSITGARLDADSNVRSGNLTGKVEARSPQGSATADTLHYDWGTGRLNARGGVRLTKAGGTLTASRIDTDRQFSQATARGGVVVRQGDMTVHAGSATTTGKMTHVTASGGVALTRPDMRVTAAQVDASDINSARHTVGRLVATGDVHLVHGALDVRAQHVDATGLNAQTKRLEHMVATGGVIARNEQGTVRAARVDWSGERIVGTDGVTLTKDGNVFTGARLQTDTAFQQATLSGDVHGRLTRGVDVTAGEVLWQRLAHHIVARQAVTARRAGMRLRADRMDASEDGAHATLTGNVVVTTDDGATLRAPAMRFARTAGQAGKVYAMDGVRFNDPRKKIQGRGQSLVYDVKTGEAVITKGSGTSDIQLFKGGKLF